jgi:hypothetical protein
MRAAIRAGLLLTLQVDERYGVIAYAMADGLLQNGEDCLTEGLPDLLGLTAGELLVG